MMLSCHGVVMVLGCHGVMVFDCHGVVMASGYHGGSHGLKGITRFWTGRRLGAIMFGIGLCGIF